MSGSLIFATKGNKVTKGLIIYVQKTFPYSEVRKNSKKKALTSKLEEIFQNH